jgi:hypothetical protein
LGNTIGTLGVDVSVGGGVSVGSGVAVGRSVGNGCVAEASTDGSSVGVSVAAAFEGKLHACTKKARIIIRVVLLYFMVSPFLPVYLTFPST